MDTRALMTTGFLAHSQLPLRAALTLLSPHIRVLGPRVAHPILPSSIRDPKMTLTTCRFSAASEPYSSSDSVPNSSSFDIGMLEKYTEKVQSEILLVHAVVDGEEDEVLVFKGHSSSLMRPTTKDPEESVLPPTAVIKYIDRMRAPFNPSNPQFIKQGLSWGEFLGSLKARGF